MTSKAKWAIDSKAKRVRGGTVLVKQCSPYQAVTSKIYCLKNRSYNNYHLQPLEGLLKLCKFF